jgi:hypothetical protein
MNKTLDELKVEAAELKIEFHPNISAPKLAEKIEAFYKASESESAPDTSGEGETGDQDAEAEAQKEVDSSNFQDYIHKQKRDAEKTSIVTIIDNDSRVNNITTTLTVSCSNEYFDLGTVILPLNERVEVRQGHLNVLRDLRIPQHVKSIADPSISVMVMRPRYSIQYENTER